jgi:hypothetical protein
MDHRRQSPALSSKDQTMKAPAIVNGVPWLDESGSPVNAHGSCVIEEGGRFYLFGEYKTDDENRFAGFSCYSSTDLVNWRFERLALPPQRVGLLGPGRIGERVKVMKSPTTGKFVMLAHSDDLTYTDPVVAVAVADDVTDEYTPLGALMYRGEPVRRWDIGSFQDEDGAGYLLLHEGDIYRLADDYLSAEELVAHDVAVGGESPAMMRANDTYFLMFSRKTSWDRNDNYYLTAPGPRGPWTHRGLIAPEGTRTWNSQCSFIFRLQGGNGVDPLHIYTGDRWSFPHQASAATYVWLPITVRGAELSLPEYFESWTPQTGAPVTLDGKTTPLAFRADRAGQSAHVSVTVDEHSVSRRIALRGRSSPDGGYARVRLVGEGSNVLADQLVDFYAPTSSSGVLYISPQVHAGTYELSVEVLGEGSVFYQKDGTRLGSTGAVVAVDAVQVLE